MLKLIFVVRHAKSSWQNPGARDIVRPLNERGMRDAPVMAKIFSSQILMPCKMVSSPAVRAYSTAQMFGEACLEKPTISINDNLYYGDHEDYLEAIKNTEAHYHTVALFGHNPKIEDFSYAILNGYHGDIPTCAILKFESYVPDWNLMEWDKLIYRDHFFPKEVDTTS